MAASTLGLIAKTGSSEKEKMSDIVDATPESHRDLVTSPLTATLTTVDRQGRPQSTAVWYLVDDGELVASTTSDRQKYKNLVGSPHCTLFIIDPANSYRTVEVRAEAELRPDPDKAVVRKFAIGYGVDQAMLVNGQEDRYTVVLHPRRIVVNPPPPG
jgi:PPOX class probable F420-dependent enzyme